MKILKCCLNCIDKNKMFSDSFLQTLDNPPNPYPLDLPVGLEEIEQRYSNLSYQTIDEIVRRHSSDLF